MGLILFNLYLGQLNPSITILGGNVVVPSEVIILNSIVLPHKEIITTYLSLSIKYYDLRVKRKS